MVVVCCMFLLYVVSCGCRYVVYVVVVLLASFVSLCVCSLAGKNGFSRLLEVKLINQIKSNFSTSE